MSKLTKMYHILKLAIPASFKNKLLKPKLRNTIEYFFDVHAKEYYSQFGEDTILQAYFEGKALRKSPESSVSPETQSETGFYVDVGAYKPMLFSNTYWFYKRGWRGINIDATPGSMGAFNLLRERDINLEVAVSEDETKLAFYYYSLNQGWDGRNVYNNLSPEAAPIGLRRPLDHPPREVRVQSLRLDTILDRHLPEGQPISFLSVDVEGHELEVLRSNDWGRYRPELIVVEQHKDAIQEILASDVARFLEEVGYSLYSWVKPSLIYKAEDIAPEP